MAPKHGNANGRRESEAYAPVVALRHEQAPRLPNSPPALQSLSQKCKLPPVQIPTKGTAMKHDNPVRPNGFALLPFAVFAAFYVGLSLLAGQLGFEMPW